MVAVEVTRCLQRHSIAETHTHRGPTLLYPLTPCTNNNLELEPGVEAMNFVKAVEETSFAARAFFTAASHTDDRLFVLAGTTQSEVAKTPDPRPYRITSVSS